MQSQKPTFMNDDKKVSDVSVYGSHSSMRHDHVSEQAVEVGIRLQNLLGTSDAARFMKNNVIALDVALRVLLQPTQRRRV